MSTLHTRQVETRATSQTTSNGFRLLSDLTTAHGLKAAKLHLAVSSTPRTGAATPTLPQQVPTLHSELTGVHGITAYLPWVMHARRDLPIVVGDIFAAFAAEPTLRHVWVLFDRHACCRAGLNSSHSNCGTRSRKPMGENKSPQAQSTSLLG